MNKLEEISKNYSEIVNEGLFVYRSLIYDYPWIEEKYDILYYYMDMLVVGKKSKYSGDFAPAGYIYNRITKEFLPIHQLNVFELGGIIIPNSIDFALERSKQYFEEPKQKM